MRTVFARSDLVKRILRKIFNQDYVTEKFFNILAYNVIPVVFNGANMSAIAPPHSYINSEDFSSVDQLAEYLLKVGRNDTLFASYFWWRDYYQIQVSRQSSYKHNNLSARPGFSTRCQELHHQSYTINNQIGHPKPPY